MRYSPVQADQKKLIWAATRPIWQHWKERVRGGRGVSQRGNTERRSEPAASGLYKPTEDLDWFV